MKYNKLFELLQSGEGIPEQKDFVESELNKMFDEVERAKRLIGYQPSLFSQNMTASVMELKSKPTTQWSAGLTMCRNKMEYWLRENLFGGGMEMYIRENQRVWVSFKARVHKYRSFGDESTEDKFERQMKSLFNRGFVLVDSISGSDKMFSDCDDNRDVFINEIADIGGDRVEFYSRPVGKNRKHVIFEVKFQIPIERVFEMPDAEKPRNVMLKEDYQALASEVTYFNDAIATVHSAGASSELSNLCLENAVGHIAYIARRLDIELESLKSYNQEMAKMRSVLVSVNIGPDDISFDGFNEMVKNRYKEMEEIFLNIGLFMEEMKINFYGDVYYYVSHSHVSEVFPDLVTIEVDGEEYIKDDPVNIDILFNVNGARIHSIESCVGPNSRYITKIVYLQKNFV